MILLTLLAAGWLIAPAEVNAARILIYPYGHCLNSHLLNAEKLGRILADEGHDISFLISDMYHLFDHTVHGHDQVAVEDYAQLVEFKGPANYTPICDYDTIDFMLYTPVRIRFNTMIDTSVRYCEQLISNTPLLKMLKAANYDLLIVESLDPCSRILADYLDIPFIPLMTTGLGHWDGNPRPPSYLPAAISPFTPTMTFVQRMSNLVIKLMYETIPVLMGFDPPFEQLKQKYNLNTSLSIANTFHRASLKLVNSDFAIEYPAPIEPDTVLIGGFSVTKPKPLPRELEEFVQSADHGVIVMSFGTLVKRFDQHWTDVFVEAFARLPQKVVWRYYDAENQTDMLAFPFGNKIKTMKWLPQADLLAHPKTKLHITHCGLNGMFETVHFGVPVVAVPLTADQFQQASKMVEYAEMGVQVDIHTLTADALYQAIQTVLTNPKYKRNAAAISARFRDQPMSASQRINYWVDYVIRHQGAPHLKSRAHTLTWYQYLSLDVIACLLLIVLTFISITITLVCALLWFLWKRLTYFTHKKKAD